MDTDIEQNEAEPEEFIYPKFIRKKGKIIYPKNGKCFKIPISSLKKRKNKDQDN